MSFITVNCPVCGGQAQIEFGKSAMCPYCGHELNMNADAGFAFAPQEAPSAPDMQFAQQEMPQTLQFAPPPAELMQQPAAMPMPQAPQYSPAMLAAAQAKRRNWHVMNSALIGLQSLMLAFGILLAAMGSRFGVPLILTWVLTIFGFGAISGLLRPDDAYIEKKPFCKTKFGQGVTQFWMGAVISGAAGGILFAILAGLFGMY